MHKSLFEVFERSADHYPAKIAVIHRRRTYSYGDISREVSRLAGQLRQFGVARGDRVVVCSGNRPETVVAFWAALAVGAGVAVISSEQDSAKVRFILEDSQARALITEPGVLGGLAPHLAALDDLRGVVLVGSDPGLEAGPGCPVVGFGALPEADEQRPAAVISEDLAALIYTSGSTGQPKGVMMSHANMLCALASLNEYLGNRHDDVILDVLPLSFDYGLYQMLMAFSLGATLVLEPNMLLPVQTLKAIERHHCTAVPGVPVLFELLDQASRFGAADLSRVRYVTNTGAALLARHIAIIKRLFPQATIFSMYGLTECKRCTYLPPHLLDRKPDSVGIAIPNTEIMVVDEDDRPCPPHQVGQLLVRGGTVMQGYWRRPEETARKIRAHPVYGGRCLYTGDYGYLDAEGLFYFKGRMDEVIKVRGRKLIPREVEDVLRQLAGVREAAVICTSLPDGDYHIAAFIEATDDTDTPPSEATLRAACRQHLENYQIPHSFQIVPRLPRNENGKVDKPELGPRYLAPTLEAPADSVPPRGVTAARAC